MRKGMEGGRGRKEGVEGTIKARERGRGRGEGGRSRRRGGKGTRREMREYGKKGRREKGE